MSQMHIGNRGVPMKCVAQPGKCPKAPGIGHFEKVEQAQEFADRLNELEANGFTYKDVPKEDINKLDNAQLILIQKELNAHKSEYEDYKQRIKWRKEVRSKAQREMKSIIDDDNNQIARVVEANNLTAQARRAWKNAEGEERKNAYAQYKEALANSNAVYQEASEITKANQENFAKLVDKKEKAETELQEFMEARAVQSSEKNYAINVDAEVDKREMDKNEDAIELPKEETPKSSPSGRVLNEKQKKLVSRLLETAGLDKKLAKGLQENATKDSPLHNRDGKHIGHEYVYEMPDYTAVIQVDNKNTIQDFMYY